jgi:hypothetical protein
MARHPRHYGNDQRYDTMYEPMRAPRGGELVILQNLLQTIETWSIKVVCVNYNQVYMRREDENELFN